MKVEQLMEMAAKQVCAKCGRGPISKTHRWVVGTGWKCPVGAKAEEKDDAPEKKEEHAEPAHKTGKSHVSAEGARVGLEHLYKRQKNADGSND